MLVSSQDYTAFVDCTCTHEVLELLALAAQVASGLAQQALEGLLLSHQDAPLVLLSV